MVVASGPCRLKTQDRVLLMLRNKSFVILCKKRLARTKNRFSEERGLRSSQQPRYLFELIKETNCDKFKLLLLLGTFLNCEIFCQQYRSTSLM